LLLGEESAAIVTIATKCSSRPSKALQLQLWQVFRKTFIEREELLRTGNLAAA